jgi:lactoylglutathione lyase
MAFLWTTLHVADLERSLIFYRDVVGLPEVSRMTPPGMTIVFLGDGTTRLELIADPRNPSPDLGKDIAIGFSVDNLDDALAHVGAHGVPTASGPFQAGPRTRFFFVKDPDGMTVQFVEEK